MVGDRRPIALPLPALPFEVTPAMQASHTHECPSWQLPKDEGYLGALPSDPLAGTVCAETVRVHAQEVHAQVCLCMCMCMRHVHAQMCLFMCVRVCIYAFAWTKSKLRAF